MQAEVLNKILLPHNHCFGCGHDNPQGLRIEIYRDGESPDRLIGSFHPKSYMEGFPGITHGGVLYTALDCMGAWVPMVLCGKAVWILRSATMTYHRPAIPDRDIQLLGILEAQGPPQEAKVVRTEARDSSGNLLAEGSFKVIPLSPEKFQKVAGLEKIPEHWRGLLGMTES